MWDFRKGEKKMKYDKIVAISQEKVRLKLRLQSKKFKICWIERKSDNGCTDKKTGFSKTLFTEI